MPPSTSSPVPQTITAGDSLQWLRRATPTINAADGWQLNYAIVGQGGVYTFAGVVHGYDWQVSVPAETTGAWAPGRYSMQEYVTNGTQRVTLGTYPLTISPNLAAAAAGVDTRSHAQKVLDAINAWLESKAPVAGSYEINGRKISYYPLADLLKLQSRYQMLVATEQAAGGGGVIGTRILVAL